MNYYSEKKLKDIGQRIRKERKELGINQDTFCDKILIGRSSLSAWETGKKLPDIDSLVRMCDLFNCELGYILCDEGYELKTRRATDIQFETGLSDLAVCNLLKAASAPDQGPKDNVLVDAQYEELRKYEIGRFAKIRFLEALLENEAEFENIAVCAYDYLFRMRMYKIDTFHEVCGIRNDEFANVAKEKAKEELAQLFKKIEEAYSGERFESWEGI